MTRYVLPLLSFYLCVFILHPHAATKIPTLSLEKDLQGSEYSQILKVDGVAIHKIEGISPQLEILSTKLLSCKSNKNLYQVQILVGSAGTKNFSYVERTYIIEWQAKKPQSSKLHFDYLSRIKREQGVEQILDIRREELWDSKNCSLLVKSFDEEVETRFSWKKDHFEKTAKELDLDLEETQNQ